MNKFFVFIIIIFLLSFHNKNENAWIRINWLGYKPAGIKVAVWCSKEETNIKTFQLVDAKTKRFAFTGSAGKPFGQYGPFNQTYRLNFSKFAKPGRYYLQAGERNHRNFKLMKMFITVLLIFASVICASKEAATIHF